LSLVQNHIHQLNIIIMKLNYGITGLVIVVCFAFANPWKASVDRDHEVLLTEFFGYFNDHNWEAMSKMYSENTKIQDQSLGPGIHIQTRADIVSHYTELENMIPDVKDSVVSIYSSRGNVVVEFVSTGTGPDGIQFELPICAVLTIKDGLIVEDHVYYDNF